MPLLEHPAAFRHGIRVLMRNSRPKDGAPSRLSDSKSMRIITSSIEEFNEALLFLNNNRFPNERIYGSVDPRNLGSAIRLFKHRQLDADYSDSRSLQRFYVDIEHSWISCLSSETSRSRKSFLIDCDTEEQSINTQKFLDLNPELLVHHYKTKNGYHYITIPFDPRAIVGGGEIKRNAMMLWAWGA